MTLTEHEQTKIWLKLAMEKIDRAYETNDKEKKAEIYDAAYLDIRESLETINHYSLTQGEEE